MFVKRDFTAGNYVECVRDIAEVCRQGSGIIAHPAHCDKFLECTDNGHVIERACGPTLHFNDEKKVCDFPHLVKCQSQSLNKGTFSN